MKAGIENGLENAPVNTEKKSPEIGKVSIARRVLATTKEWNLAKSHFGRKSRFKTMKYRKKGNFALRHSFIKIKNHIVALANKAIEGKDAIIGQGNFGIVKFGESEDGKKFAIKIEGRKRRSPNDPELQVLNTVPNYYCGEDDRSILKRQYHGNVTASKLYTLMELLEGDELEKQLTSLTPIQQLIVALKSCIAIHELHQNGIIHADIKPANLMANICGNNISVKPVDFGFSMLLKPDQKFICLSNWKGTPGYIAPEVYRGIFSKQSDIYALGYMFKMDLQLPSRLCRNMLHPCSSYRSSLNEVVTDLLNEIEKLSNGDIFLKQLVDDARAAFVTKPEDVIVKPSVAATQLAVAVTAPKAATPGNLTYWQYVCEKATQAFQEPLAFICNRLKLTNGT